jgi:putative inorganic carbon (HCO3(-)) transporter
MNADRATAAVRDAGLYLFAAALPFNLWATQAGLGLAALGVLGRWALCRERPRFPVELGAPTGLYVAAVLVSHLGSGEPVPGADAVLGFWPALAPFPLVAAIPDERMLRRMLALSAVMAALMGAYGVLQHFTGADWFRVHTTIARPAPAAPGRFLAIGNFEAHTTYAFSLSFVVLLCAALAVESRAWRARGVFLGIAGVAAAGVLVSYVRSMWLGLALGVFTIAFVRRGPALRVALALAAAGAIAVAAVPSLRARAVSIVDPKYNAGRAYIWDRSWRMLADHPVAGIGFGGYRRLQDAYFDPGAPPDVVPRTGAHSTYLHLAVETGALGLVAFLWIWIRFFGYALGRLREVTAPPGFGRGWTAGAIAGVACFLAGSFFQESYFDGEVAFMLWFVVSGVFVVGRRASST